MADDNTGRSFGKGVKLPAGVAAEDFLMEMRGRYDDSYSANVLNLQAAVEDTGFVAGAQWDPQTQARRIANRKPVLTLNRLLAFIGQVIGNRRLNETVVRVLPDNGGTKAEARLRQGLIRNIEKTSRADIAYDTALQQAAIGGIGNFRVVADYAGYDVFEQDLKVEALTDFTCITWDHLMNDPTGRDARYCFVEDNMSLKEFKKRWPWAQTGDFGASLAPSNTVIGPQWWAIDTCKVVSYWCMKFDERTVAQLNDGTTCDVTDKDPSEYLPNIAQHPRTGEPYIRTARRPYAEMYLCTSNSILEGPYRLYTYRVPVFRVPGWEINVAGSKQVFGIVRFLKDPQRLNNYWLSTVAEKLMQAPKAKWIATKSAVQGFEEKWRNSHLSDDPLLVWNDKETDKQPVPVPPVQMEPALIQAAGMAAQDMRDISNIHEASLGITSNEVSGKAITARQRVGELGTVIYHDNLNMAIEECGRVLNDLIPRYYDTVRTVKILGEDGKADIVQINNPDDPDCHITDGKYSVTVVTGPSYATKRIEAVETLQAFVNAAPDAMAPALDIIVDNLDIPGAEQLSKRLKANLPPNLRDPEEMTPQEKEQAAAAQQEAAEQADLAKQNAMLVNKKLNSDANAADARAEQSRALSQVAMMQAEIAMHQAGKTDAEITQIMAVIRKTDAETDKIVSETARTDAEIDNIDAQTSSTRVNDVLAVRQQGIDREQAHADRKLAAKAAKEKPKNAQQNR